MTKQVSNDDIQYHIGLSKDMIEGAEYVLVPGDPGRVEGLAKAFDPEAKHIGTCREYTSYLADFHGQKILVCSTGMGAPSTAIGVEELATIGLKYFLRIGTTGTIQPHINLADIIISNAAVRLEGTSSHYAPIEFPAVASVSLTNNLITAAKNVEVPHHIGITISSDTFWPGQERYDNFSGYVLRRFRNSMDEWSALGVTNFEMEAATLFVLASIFGLEAGCLCGVIAKRDASEAPDLNAKQLCKDRWEAVAKEAIYLSLQERGLI